MTFLSNWKNIFSKEIDYLYLVKNYPKQYLDYYKTYRKLIYGVLNGLGINRIKPVQKNQWKLSYGTCYFIGHCYFEGVSQSVFVKVNGLNLEDCHKNEIILNEYIMKHSDYIYDRMPKIIFHERVENLRIIVYEYVPLSQVTINKSFYDALNKIVSEYNRIGVLHTDFGLSNIGMYRGEYYFFDYGTSLCENSDDIRIRYSSAYNHIDKIPKDALELLPDATYYYDDLVHLGLNGQDHISHNFLVANDKVAFAKLGEHIVKYSLFPRPGSVVKILKKQSNVIT